MRFLLSTILFLGCLCSQAQTTDTVSVVTPNKPNYGDSIRQARRRIWKSTVTPQMSAYNQYRLFAPSTFYHAIAQHNLYLRDKEQDIYDQAVDDALLNIYLKTNCVMPEESMRQSPPRYVRRWPWRRRMLRLHKR